LCELATSCPTAITRSGKSSFLSYLGILQAQQHSPPHGRAAEGALDGAAVLDVVIRKMITGEKRPALVGEAEVEHREQPRVYTQMSG